MRAPSARMRRLADHWLQDQVTVTAVTGQSVVDHDLVETETEIWYGPAHIYTDSETTAVPTPGQKPVNTVTMTVAHDVTLPQVGHYVTVDASDDARMVGTRWTIETVQVDGILTQRHYTLIAVTP